MVVVDFYVGVERIPLLFTDLDSGHPDLRFPPPHSAAKRIPHTELGLDTS